MADKITQKGVTAINGDNAGRDIFKDISLEVMVYSGPISPMTALTETLKRELRDNKEIQSILPTLGHYMSLVDGDDVIGLEEKLRAANRDQEIEKALGKKEIIAKRLQKHSTYRSAQEIYILVLGNILERFKAYVTPLIESGAPDAEIKICIFENVVNPTMNMMEQNALKIYWDEIWGMIYFLTGNCHIKWTT